jgi:hypothetical protein
MRTSAKKFTTKSEPPFLAGLVFEAVGLAITLTSTKCVRFLGLMTQVIPCEYIPIANIRE